MDLTPLDQAVEAAYNTALADPQHVPEQTIAPGVTLQTDVYASPAGNGFRVICKVNIPEAGYIAARVRNHGPDTASEQAWPAEGIEAGAKRHAQKHLLAVEKHVTKYFSSLALIEAHRKITTNALAGTLANIPKTLAVAGWIDSLKDPAAGILAFTAPPYAFEEIVLE
jgi:hypothetical protein